MICRRAGWTGRGSGRGGARSIPPSPPSPPRAAVGGGWVGFRGAARIRFRRRRPGKSPLLWVWVLAGQARPGPARSEEKSACTGGTGLQYDEKQSIIQQPEGRGRERVIFTRPLYVCEGPRGEAGGAVCAECGGGHRADPLTSPEQHRLGGPPKSTVPNHVPWNSKNIEYARFSFQTNTSPLISLIPFSAKRGVLISEISGCSDRSE